MEQGDTVTQLLARWGDGNPAALDELTPRVYGELQSIARTYLKRRRPGETLQPTALVNEAWIRLMSQPQPARFENRSHFFGIAARLMRLVLVDYTRRHSAAKRGSGACHVTLQEAAVLLPSRAPDILDVNEALDNLAKLDERKAKVIELRYFGGMDREEIADSLGVSVATVKRDLRLGEAWLRRFLLGQTS